MKRNLFAFICFASTSLWSIANATTVTYNFTGTTQSVGSTGVLQQGGNGSGGMVFTTSPQGFNNGGAASTITVYGETAPNGIQAGADDGGPSVFGSTTGLFEVNSNGTNTATGIAPYISSQASGTSPNLNLTLENGITETDVLLINLSNLTAGSTVSFVMATGAQATANTGINVWMGTGASTPTGMGTGGPTPLTEIAALTGQSVNGAGGGATTKAFNLPSTLSSNEWIAIQADCHYLLLQSLSVTPGAVPEPSFYGFFAVGMVGLVIGCRKLRARQAAAALEQA